MSPIEDTFADYLMYVAADQAGGALHTVAVLQTYKADLLKGQGLSPEAVTEMRYTIDLSLRATKQTAAMIGYAMVGMVVTERHLWSNFEN